MKGDLMKIMIIGLIEDKIIIIIDNFRMITDNRITEIIDKIIMIMKISKIIGPIRKELNNNKIVHNFILKIITRDIKTL